MDSIFQSQSNENFKGIIQDILSSLYSSKHAPSKHTEFHVYQSAKENIRTLFSESNFDITKIAEILNTKDWSKENVDYFLKSFEEQKTNLLCDALNNYNSNYGDTVEDFDWLLKFVLGTSDLKTLKTPVLELILSILDIDGGLKKILYDINKDVLLKLIDVLENIE